MPSQAWHNPQGQLEVACQGDLKGHREPRYCINGGVRRSCQGRVRKTYQLGMAGPPLSKRKRKRKACQVKLGMILKDEGGLSKCQINATGNSCIQKRWCKIVQRVRNSPKICTYLGISSTKWNRKGPREEGTFFGGGKTVTVEVSHLSQKKGSYSGI